MNLHTDHKFGMLAIVLAVFLLLSVLLCACSDSSNEGEGTFDNTSTSNVTSDSGDEVTKSPTTDHNGSSSDDDGNHENETGGESTAGGKLDNKGEQSDIINEYDW